MTDIKHLVKVINQVGLHPYQAKMAVLLLGVNGIKNALEFVYGLQERGLTPGAEAITSTHCKKRGMHD